MKKLLIATAALAMVAGTAQAQSSVTAYGRLDAGYKSYETTSTANVEKKTTGIGYSAFTSSRLGFQGTEDLGGGLKAGFTLEGGISDAVGTTGSANANSFNFGRHQFLTLSSANAGSLLLGKTDSLVKQVFDGFDAGFSNNLVGAYDSMGNAADFGSTNTANVIGNRRDAVARYTSPKFANVNVSVGLIEASVEETGKTDLDDSGYEAGLKYSAGALSLAAAYRSVDTKTQAVTATGIYAGLAQLSATDLGKAQSDLSDKTTDSTAIGASYNFGPVVAFAQYFDQDVKNNLDSTKVKEDAFAVGVRVPMGKSTLFASYTDGDRTSATGVKTDIEGMQVGVKYDLSKRTYGYVAYGEAEKQEAGANKAKAENLAIGIAHHF